MKKETNKRNTLSVLVVCIMLMATFLTACSSNQKTDISTKEDIKKVETAKQEVTEIVEQEESKVEEIATPEPTIEPTPEPTPLPTPDLESTLPGVEWIQSFNGIIEEPKLVVFNDSTNKKVILEELQEVEFYDDDTLAVYIPNNAGEVTRYLLFENVEYYDSVVTLKNISSVIQREGYSSATVIDIEFNGEPMKLYCYLKLMGNP